jgi:hypothetical protein
VFHSLIMPFKKNGSPPTYSSAASRELVTAIVLSGSSVSSRNAPQYQFAGSQRRGSDDDAGPQVLPQPGRLRKITIPYPGRYLVGSSVARLPSRRLVASAMPIIPLFRATSFSAALLILDHLWVELPHALCLLAAPVHDYPVLVVLHHLLDGDRVVFGTEIADPATRLDD